MARDLRCSHAAALLAAAAVLFENMHVTQSRLVLLDSQVIFYLALSLACALRLWRTDPGTARRVGWAVATATACCGCLSSKFTAVPTIVLIGAECIVGAAFTMGKDPVELWVILVMAVVGAGGYIATYVPHFRLLPLSGDGDPFHTIEFQRKLLGNQYYDADAKPLSFFQAFIELNEEMIRSNAAIETRHPAESKWYTWPVNWRGFFYDSGGSRSGETYEMVYLLGNPLVVWGVLLVVVATFLVVAVGVRWRRHPKYATVWFLLAGWFINLLPYILVSGSSMRTCQQPFGLIG